MRLPSSLIKIGALATVVAVLVGLQFAGVDPASRREQAAIQRVRDLRERDTQLSLLLMRARQGLLASYDPIVQATQTIEASNRRLLEPEPGLHAGETAAIGATRDAAAQTVRAKLRAIEDFKSSFAILRSSISLLSVLAVDLGEIHPRSELETETYLRANFLLLALSRFMVGAGNEPLRAVERGRAALAASPSTPEPLASAVLKILGTAAVVQRSRTESDQRMAEVMNLPVGARLDDLIAAHGQQIERLALQRHAIDLALGVAALMSLLVGLRGLRARRAARLSLQRQVEERTHDLAEANAALTRTSRAKIDFLAKMADEIRTPLAAILGLADMLEDQRLQHTERRGVAGVIRRKGEQLLEIFSEILEITRIETGKLTVQAIPCSPRQIIEEVCALLRRRAEARDVVLTLQIDPEALPAWIESDPARLRVILVNLVGNAIKLTERGTVSVVLGAVSRSGPCLRFEVRHGGMGMAPEDGLATCRRLTAVLGGEISVRSTPGQDTTFAFLLPVTEVAEGPAEQQAPLITDPHGLPAWTGLRVLVADSSADVRLLVTRFLADIDAEVAVVSDGRQAVETALTAWREGRGFDVILMDLRMPELDGAEVVQILRTAGLVIPIIALASSASPADRERCARAGYTDVLAKPVDRGQLIQKITALPVGGAREMERRPTPAPASAGRDAREPAAPSPFNADRLLELVGGDQSMRDSILALFQKDAPALLQVIQSAVSSTDSAAIRAAAHKLKGMLLTVGALEAAAAATALESSARADESDRFEPLARSLEADLTRVCESMAQATAPPA